MSLPVYLDYNATTPCAREVLDAMLPYFCDEFGNPASNHPYGWLAEEAVDLAREKVADLIGAKPSEIVFTSGATEALNLAIRGHMQRSREKNGKTHLITVATEHSSVLDTISELQQWGYTCSVLPVAKDGTLDLKVLEQAITPQTTLIALMAVNNETGVIHPVAKIGEIAKKNGITFLCDGVQAVGKMPVSVSEWGVDLLAFSGHKVYGPKGIGVLYIRSAYSKDSLTPQLTGGGHEFGLRSGTLNVPGIVGLGAACQLAKRSLEADTRSIETLRNRLEEAVLLLPDTKRNGHKQSRILHVTSITFHGLPGKQLLIALNKKIAVSSGSACSSVTERGSHVLKAMGLTEESAKSTVRFSLGKFTTQADIDFAIDHVRSCYARLKSQ